jgi:hypothetical protein
MAGQNGLPLFKLRESAGVECIEEVGNWRGRESKSDRPEWADGSSGLSAGVASSPFVHM